MGRKITNGIQQIQGKGSIRSLVAFLQPPAAGTPPRRAGAQHLCTVGITPSRAKQGEEGAEVGKVTAAQKYFFKIRFFLVPLL